MDGRDYHFVDEAGFARLRERGAFLECAEVFGHWYGTARDPVESALDAGRDVVFDIDWQGSQQLAEAVQGDLVRIFILPPSLEALEERLKRRAQDTPAVVAERMSRAADEMSHYDEYDYVVVNTALERSVEEVRSILCAERLRRGRLKGLDEFVAQNSRWARSRLRANPRYRTFHTVEGTRGKRQREQPAGFLEARKVDPVARCALEAETAEITLRTHCDDGRVSRRCGPIECGSD